MEQPIAVGACTRCRGALTRVDDIGETYRSCVQCGHVVYGSRFEVAPGSARRATEQSSRWRPRQAADRSAVRRRQIARARARARAGLPEDAVA